MTIDLDPRRKVTTSVPDLVLPDDRADRAVVSMTRLVVPRGHGARLPLALLPWQDEATRTVFADRPPRQMVEAVPRGSGKTTWAAALGVHGATYDGVPDPVVVLVGVNEEQSRRLLWVCRRFIEEDPILAERARVYQDRIRFPCWSSEIVALPAEAKGLLGLDFSLAIVDEIGAVDPLVYEAIATASGKRPTSTVLAIGSPVPGASQLLRDLLAYADTGGIWARHFHAPDGCAVDDRDAWAEANPSYGVLVHEDDMAHLAATTLEPSFRAYRLGQFVDAAGVWLPIDRWNDCADASRIVPHGTEVSIGFDGSFARDTTALIGCTLDGHVFVLGLWENPGNDTAWRVPRRDVDDAVAMAFDRYDVRSLACDPFIWRDAIEQWADRWGDEVVVEWPTTSNARIAKAAERFATAVLEGTLTHDGDSRLARHVAQCHVKVTPFGPVPTKDSKMSPRKIDGAIAALVAFDRAAQLPVRKRKRAMSF